jgi:rare lipoprotein A
MKQFRGGVERTASQKVYKVKTTAWYSLNRRGVGGPLKTLILLQPPDGDNTMIHGFIILLSVLITAVANAGESGTASHYSTRDKDQNRTRTACGPPLRDHGLTAAHKTLPCGSRIRVTNKANGRSTVVTITDRGPFARGRVIDLSMGAAHALGFHGLARVSLNRI